MRIALVVNGDWPAMLVIATVNLKPVKLVEILVMMIVELLDETTKTTLLMFTPLVRQRNEMGGVPEAATLNPTGWVVHIEADGKDKGGAVVSYVIDGKIENLPLPNRSITGTWKSQKENGAFKIGRQ